MPEIPTQSNPNQQMSQGINWKNILIGVVVGATLVGGGFLVYNAYQAKPKESTPTTTKTSTSSANPAPQTSPPATKDETADWKTYEGKLVNLSLKYPSNWTVSEDDKGVYVGEYKEGTGYISQSNQEPEIILQDSANNRILKVIRRGSFIGSYSEPKEVDVIVSGISSKKSYWILINLSENGSKPTTSVPTYSTIQLSVNGTSFLIYGEWKEKDTEADKILDQIVSTFKFLD